MSRHRAIALLATLLAAGVALSGCSFLRLPGNTTESSGYRADEVNLQVLYAAGDTGGVATQRIRVGPSDDGELSIDISEDEVSGVGDMTRAASWNAVSVTTLLTGAPLDINYRFAFDGRIDGPSAGALTTIGLLSMFYGTEIDPETTMTGTINPTGTVGTVGGIPEKITGVIDAGEISKVLIPAGQRNVPNSEGVLVDVVRLGAENDVEVIEVADVYDAYEQLTGEELPSPEQSTTPTVTGKSYDKYKSATDETLARYDRAAAEFLAFSPEVQALAGTATSQAVAYADRARSLQQQGLQGGAFFEASNAAVNMEALTGAFSVIQSIFNGQVDVLGQRIASLSTVDAEVNAFIDNLGTYSPSTLNDAEALITAYGNTFDAFSVLQFAGGQLQAIFDRASNGEYTSPDQLISDALVPLIYYDFGRAQLEFAKSTFDIGRDNDGAAIAEGVDIDAVSSFFRRAADANAAAFESGVIQPFAESRGESNDLFRNALGSVDFEVALAYAAQQELPAIQDYIGTGDNAAYAAMGYGYVNYARNAVLIEKYYNNGVLDENLQLVGVNSDTILTRALDLGRSQTAKGVSILSDNGNEPVLTTGAFEQAGVAREGTVTEKFQAIAQYSGSFVMSRILAYAGGFEREGYEAG